MSELFPHPSGNVIHKYELLPGPNQTTLINIEVPSVHRLVSIQSQGSSIFAWMLVDPSSELTNVYFRAIPTGVPITCPIGDHLATVQVREVDATFVFHIFRAIGVQ